MPLALGGIALVAACRPPADPMEKKREQMVATQIAARGIRDPRVLAAMRKVPRHLFVPAADAASAYDYRPLPIGSGRSS